MWSRRRAFGVIAMISAAACARAYVAEDPFSGGGLSPDRPGVRTVQVHFGGRCGICSVSLDVAGRRDLFVDSVVIRRRHRVVAMPGTVISMSAAPVGDWGPVSRVEIRVDGEVLAEASTGASDGLPGEVGDGALSIRATIPER